MKSETEYNVAKEIMGSNFIGEQELRQQTKIEFLIDHVPSIPFSKDELEKKRGDYILLLGVSKFMDGSPITIRNMIHIFGMNPDKLEPCFYNQDWYNKEEFVDNGMNDEWILIRKSVIDESRSRDPEGMVGQYSFLPAVVCTYAFFISWLLKGIVLWPYDYIWCTDKDHNGDRIYVGRYYDIDQINRNGFSIHRHLSIRNCYGCI